jgi:hypothetical protein
MRQRDGVTAVTATRYPPWPQEKRGRVGAARPRAAGAGGPRPSRRHAVIRAARLDRPRPPLSGERQ